MIGLLPFGLSKIFSLWLYSNNQQFIAAKISMKSLLWNIIFSLALIIPYEAAGLAFASTLSGFILFYLTLKEFGFKRFYLLIKT
jgi:putative peptidoglycan lipid II flippase